MLSTIKFQLNVYGIGVGIKDDQYSTYLCKDKLYNIIVTNYYHALIYISLQHTPTWNVSWLKASRHGVFQYSDAFF